MWPFTKTMTKSSVTLQESNKISNIAAVVRTVKLKASKYFERENFVYPDETLYEIKRAIKADSYLSESQSKLKEKIFKEGYYLKGNQKCIDYLKARLRLMSHMNETPVEVLFQEIADDLITYSNSFVLKIRKDSLPVLHASSPLDERIVAGYMRLDPCAVVIVTDDYGNVTRYEVNDENDEPQKILPKDMVHFFVDREPGKKYGTPRLAPVLEDVKALRDIEGDMLTLVHRFCFPLFHIKVGLPQNGYQGTPTDVMDIEAKISDMSEDGMLVTNEKVSIAAIGAENAALDLLGYLEYFEKRVFSGANTSSKQMGRDTNTTPDSLEGQVHDTVKHIQKYFSWLIKYNIFTEILLEGGFNPIYDEDNVVDMIFNEISLDTRIKRENHEVLKYQSNVQTLEETRIKNGDDAQVDESDLYVDNVTNYTSGVQTQQKVEGEIKVAKEQSKLDVGNSSSKPDKDNKKQKKSKAVETNNRPQNQHGIYSVKIKESLAYTKKIDKLSKDCCKTYWDLSNKNFIESDKAEIAQKISDSFNDILYDTIQQAYIAANNTLTKDISKLIQAYSTAFNESVDKIIKDITDKELLDKREYRLRFAIEYWRKKMFWHIVALTQKEKNKSELKISFSSDKDQQSNNGIVKLSEINYESMAKQLPPYHPGCTCKLDINEGR